MLKAFKYRLYPDVEQRIFIAKHLGCCRWVYNYMLNVKKTAYEKDKTKLGRYDLQAMLPVLKKVEETKWLAEVNAQSLQMELEHLDKAFRNFFKGSGFPKFKCKYDNRQKYQYAGTVKVDFGNDTITLPKFEKPIKAVITRRFDGDPRTTTIERTPTGKYYISILAEVNIEKPQLKPVNKKTAIGIDTGITNFLTLSDGTIFPNNRYLKRSITRLALLHQRLSNKKKGSRNGVKQRIKVARLYERITNQRLDYLHKVTCKLTNENQGGTICIEDLSVANMIQNPNLAQALSDVSIGRFYEILGYKCAWKGINLLKIGRWEPSSKTCSCCGNVKQDLTLADRTYRCGNCGLKLDRDLNAAINIREVAIKENTGQGVPEVRTAKRKRSSNGVIAIAETTQQTADVEVRI